MSDSSSSEADTKSRSEEETEEEPPESQTAANDLTEQGGNENKGKEDEVDRTFEELGLREELWQACAALGWKKPSRIQAEAIPIALEKKDIIGLAETGSGKTGAFGLPMLQALLDKPQRLFGLVLTPTRELAFQIAEQFEALGKNIGVKCAVLVGMSIISRLGVASG